MAVEKKLKAVALKYPKDADAPYISVSGQGGRAQQILDLAEKNKIPVVQNEVLTDVLYLQNCGSLIPEETYEVIAKIFAFIQTIERD